MILPPRPDGSRLEIPSESHQIIIIGANGAGKTRFTNALADECGERTFRISALHAIYGNKDSHDGKHDNCSKNTVDEIFEEQATSQAFLQGNASNSFEKLMVLMLNDEISSLVKFKVDKGTTPPARKGKILKNKVNKYKPESTTGLPHTKLDRVLEMWTRIFPDNTVLRDGATLLFRTKHADDTYSQIRLSDGEKAVLYYLGAITFAPRGARIFVDNPAIFLHPSITASLWNTIEQMRPDCRFVYTTHDLDFASTRTFSTIVWIRSCNLFDGTWDYDILSPQTGISDEIYLTIIGARKPVLFIEGDGIHSIDARLYPLIFPEYTIKSLGSCNRVIESTRTFNSLKSFHHLISRGIVDRDRRDDAEVQYLRHKNILVPDVAEIENMILLEPVVRAVAQHCGRNPDHVFAQVKKVVVDMFAKELRQQALQHTRHKVKRTVEYTIDRRFTSIGGLERHMQALVSEINPHKLYDDFVRHFTHILEIGDYAAILKVFNQKTMLPNSNVAQLCGLTDGKDSYIRRIVTILSHNDTQEATIIRESIRNCFGLE